MAGTKWSIDANGNLTSAGTLTSTGAIINNSGLTEYIPATLNAYEQSTAVSLTLTGPWGATTSTLATIFTRVGNVVVMQWGNSSPTSRVASATSTITTSTGTAIPAKFLPGTANIFLPMPVINSASGNIGQWGSFFFTGGVLTITTAINNTFTSGNNVGIIAGAISWLA
jgi:hypothetical protein